MSENNPVGFASGRDSIKYTRPIESVPFVVASTPSAIRLPKDRNISMVAMLFTGTAAITVAGAQTGNGIAELINNIRLVRNGSEVIANIPLESLAFGNIYHRRAASVVQPNWASATNQAFEVEGYIDLSFIGGMRAKDSILEALGSSELTLQWDFQPYASASTATYTVTGGTVQVQVFEELELPDAGGNVSRPTHVSRHWYEERTYAGVASESLLMPRNRLFSSIVIETKTAAGALSNAILGTLSLKVGSDVRRQFNTAAMLKELSSAMSEFGLGTGYYVLDFTAPENGIGRSIRDCLSTYGNGQDVKLEYTTLAAGSVGLTYRGFEAL